MDLTRESQSVSWPDSSRFRNHTRAYPCEIRPTVFGVGGKVLWKEKKWFTLYNQPVGSSPWNIGKSSLTNLVCIFSPYSRFNTLNEELFGLLLRFLFCISAVKAVICYIIDCIYLFRIAKSPSTEFSRAAKTSCSCVKRVPSIIKNQIFLPEIGVSLIPNVIIL